MFHEHNCRSRCPAHCHTSRRHFIAAAGATIAGTLLLPGCSTSSKPSAEIQRIKPMGPASTCTPTLRAAFVRRQEEYGMWWPGQIYDGEAARRNYTRQIQQAAKDLNIKLDLRAEPIFTAQEADAWIAESVAAKADGLLVVLLDRQKHAWSTAAKAVDSKIPTVIFSPLGSSFTTNTINLAERTGCCICSTDDFSQVRYGMKMLGAGARIRQTRCLVIAGKNTRDVTLPHLGTQLHYIPAQTFLDIYNQTPENAEVLALADDLIRRSRGLHGGCTRQDVINGIKSYVVARSLLEKEQADAISMDCLGALGSSKVSLPCIAWSKMNDDGIPAACEADTGAIATHIVVQNLFDKPGFQQDPVADTVNDALIGAHCSCPTRLNGFDAKPERYDIVPHHGARDATARPHWPAGQRVTMADVVIGSNEKPTEIIAAAGNVMDNISAPPAGGCVVSVRVKFESNTNILAFPGFHQLFFFGDHCRQLAQYCRLYGLQYTPA